MKPIPVLAVSDIFARGYELLDGQLGPERRVSVDVEWMRGVGVKLVASSTSGRLYAPPWVTLIEKLYRRNVRNLAIARCARDPEWATGLLSTYALGGAAAVTELIKADP